MKSCIFRANLPLQAIAVAGAIGFAAPASVALAQGTQGQGSQSQKGESSAAASKPPGNVSGVVVQPAPKLNKIPPAKKAALDAEAAKRKTWQTYRNTTAPASAPARATPGMSASARAENYPGLRSLPSH
jgi:hypothetical protein